MVWDFGENCPKIIKKKNALFKKILTSKLDLRTYLEDQ